MNPRIVIAGFVAAVAFCARAAEESWKVGRMVGGPRGWATATELLDGRVLIAGGHAQHDDHLTSCVLFDPASDATRLTGSLHTSRHEHTATLLKDGRVLVVGGYTLPQQWLDDAEIYDPKSGEWKIVKPLFKHGVEHRSVLLPDGRVFVLGGAIGSGEFSDRGEFFDPRNDSWTESHVHWKTMANFSVTPLKDGSLFLAGGDLTAGQTPTALVYDPAADEIRHSIELPRTFYWHSATLLADGRVLVTSGSTGEWNIVGNTYVIDPANARIEPGPAMKSGSICHGSIQLPDGGLLVIGGSSAGQVGKPLNVVERLDPKTGRWTEGPALNSPRCLCTAVAQLRDGRIVVFGGDNGVEGIGTMETLPAAGFKTNTTPEQEIQVPGWIAFAPRISYTNGL